MLGSCTILLMGCGRASEALEGPTYVCIGFRVFCHAHTISTASEDYLESLYHHKNVLI